MENIVLRQRKHSFMMKKVMLYERESITFFLYLHQVLFKENNRPRKAFIIK